MDKPTVHQETTFSRKDYLTCGQFAKLCQVKKQTLFHYDDIGLLKPTITDEKGYRFYSYKQYESFALISSLKETGLSLAQISEYLSNRGSKSHLETMREALDGIRAKIAYLQQVETAVSIEIDRAEEAERLYTSDILVMQLEELPLIRSIDLDALDSVELIGAVKSFSSTYEVACAVLDTAALQRGEWDHYRFMLAFEPLVNQRALGELRRRGPETHPYLRPTGIYVVAYHKGPFEKAGETYRRLLDHCVTNGLALGGYAYEEYLQNELTASSEDDLLTRICIQVSPESHQ